MISDASTTVDDWDTEHSSVRTALLEYDLAHTERNAGMCLLHRDGRRGYAGATDSARVSNFDRQLYNGFVISIAFTESRYAMARRRYDLHVNPQSKGPDPRNAAYVLYTLLIRSG